MKTMRDIEMEATKKKIMSPRQQMMKNAKKIKIMTMMNGQESCRMVMGMETTTTPPEGEAVSQGGELARDATTKMERESC